MENLRASLILPWRKNKLNETGHSRVQHSLRSSEFISVLLGGAGASLSKLLREPPPPPNKTQT